MNYDGIFVFENEGNIITHNIKRILPKNEVYKTCKLIPIENSATLNFDKELSKDPLILPKLYAALSYLTGESDENYDDYKGSFNFTFELSINKNGNLSKYYYYISHFRLSIGFSIEEIVPLNDLRKEKYYTQPNDKLFSDQDICNFSSYFCFYVIKQIEALKYIPKPFICYSDSNQLLFGFNNRYFYESYDDYEEYEIKKQLFESLDDCEEYEIRK